MRTLYILMCSRLSTWLRQMGHLLVCLRSSCAHSWHMHLRGTHVAANYVV